MVEVGLGHRGAEAVREAVAVVPVEVAAGVPSRQDGAAAAAEQVVAAPAADRIGSDRPPLPERPEVEVEPNLGVLPDVADSDLLVAGLLPAGVDVSERIEDVHPGVRRAEAGLESGQAALGEDAPGLAAQGVVDPPEDREV